MFNSEVLSIVIGLTFIYLLYSLLATIIQELLASVFNFRAKILEKALCRMLQDQHPARYKSVLTRLLSRFKKPKRPQNLVQVFYRHPLIKFLSEDARSKPSYLTRETFSKIMLDLLKGRQIKPGADPAPFIQTSLDQQRIEWADISIAEDSDTLLFLRSIWTEAQADVDKFKWLLENWFDETMNRASEWYKKYTQFLLLAIGFGIAAAFNVDTIAIVGKLEKDPELREQVVAQAANFMEANAHLDQEPYAKEHPETAIRDSTKQQAQDSLAEQQYLALKKRRAELFTRADQLINNDIAKVNNLLSIGRSENSCKEQCLSCTLKFLAGWLLTALAISLGAPFWFDLLNKLMKLRSATPATSDKLSDKPSHTDTTIKIERKG